ncbi:MAG TPA: response regulator [bacterium]|nr:response regulator [bacterium]HOL48324.1 response regulator [bacterium]HPQ18550.1 response regulator [bacterium]
MTENTTESYPKIQKPDGSKFNFLVVDDSSFMRKHLIKIIQNINGNIVGEADNGFDAVHKYKELKPDLVTLDITMPNKDGIKTLKEILFYDPNAIVVMVTAISHLDMIKTAMEIGAKHYIKKPFKPTDVGYILSKVLRNYKEVVFIQ